MSDFIDKEIQDILSEYTAKAQALVASNHPRANQFALFLQPNLDLSLKIQLLFIHLYSQSHKVSDPVNIDKAIQLGSVLLKMTNLSNGSSIESRPILRLSIVPDTEKEQIWTMVAQLYRNRFDKFGTLEDLEQSISVIQRSMELFSDGGQQDSMRESMLSKNLSEKFRTFASTDANILNQAIDYGRQALRRYEDNPGAKARIAYLGVLGDALIARFTYFKSIQDNDDAIALMSEALNVAMENGYTGHRLALQRNNLASALRLKLRSHDPRVDRLNNAKKCVELLRQAITDTPQTSIIPDRFSMEYTLAGSLVDWHGALGNKEGLEEGIQITQSLIDIPNLTLRRRIPLGGLLGIALYYRHKISGSLDDLNRSIQVLEETLTLKGDFRVSDHEFELSALPYMLWWRYRLLEDDKDLDRLSSVLSQMENSLTMSLELYFMNMCMSAYVHYRRKRFEESVKDFQVAINILPNVLLSGKDYHTDLLVDPDANNSGFIQLAQHGVVACIACGKYAEAIEILENGRSIGWSKNFRLRSKFEKLEVEYPDYAEKLHKLIRNAIVSEDERSRSQSPYSPGAMTGSAWERMFISSQSLMQLLKEIRNLKGYERFWLPMKYNELAIVALKGPVVVVNLCKWKSHALLITASTSDRPQAVPLSSQIWQLVQQRSEEFRKGTSDMESGLLTEADLSRRILRPILRDLWEYIVFPVSQALKTLSPYARRIWWCPTGPLAALPLHLAANGNDEPPYVSSYVMTLTSLFHAQSSLKKAQDVKVLAVSCPNVPGYPSLPGAVKEIDILKGTLPNEALTPLVEGEATVESILQQLPTHSWIHLSCHGYPATGNDAYRSRFVLSDGNLYVSDIIRQPSFSAEFAFLSACHTASSIPVLDDEAIHLASGMSFLGFRSIIATLWAVRDDITPLLISKVYQYLFRKPDRIPDPEDAAEALHVTVQALLRDKSKGKAIPMIRLAPFVHIGV